MKKLQLHKPHGANRYCGPTALSAITGLSRDDIAALARRFSGRPAIKGMQHDEAKAVIAQLGGTMELVGIGSPAQKQTLAEWMEQRSTKARTSYLLVSVTEHYVAVLRDTVLCSLQGGEPAHILSARCRNHRFKRAWIVTLPDKVKLPEGLQKARAAQARQRKHASGAGAKARRLAAKLHLEFEKDNPFIITSLAESGTEMWRELLLKAGFELTPDADYDEVWEVFYNEVLGGSSYGRDWAEALGVVEGVADFVKKHTGIDPAGRGGIIG